MRHILVTALLGGTILVSACSSGNEQAEVDRALADINVIDETNLNEVMLHAADPNESVNYFRRALQGNPDRIDLRRGLAKSLMRANQPTPAVSAWRAVLELQGATSEDHVGYAESLIRSGQWKEAKAQLDSIPPTYETFDRYRLEAMVADSNKEWKKSDSYYDVALGLTTKPSGVLNNWGYSKLTRGDFAGAEQLFAEALTYNPDLFTAKNNLVLARGAQRKYTLPIVQMTQEERAQLLYTAALAAVKQGDVETGKSLLREAIDTHPMYFEAAVRSLEALGAKQG